MPCCVRFLSLKVEVTNYSIASMGAILLLEILELFIYFSTEAEKVLPLVIVLLIVFLWSIIKVNYKLNLASLSRYQLPL